MKKVISIVLTLLMLMSVVTPVMATEGEIQDVLSEQMPILEEVSDESENVDLEEAEEFNLAEDPSEHSIGEAFYTEAIATPARSRAAQDRATLYFNANQNYSEAFEVLRLVNIERAKIGEPALQMDRDLLVAAMQRAAELAIHYDRNHLRPTGEACYTVSNKMNSENIAKGYNAYRTAADVMGGWMNSTGHKNNILRSGQKGIGVGCVKIGNATYWVQVFGASNVAVATSGSYSNNTVEAKVDVDTARIDAETRVSFYKPELVFSPSGNLIMGGSKTARFNIKESFYLTPILSKSITFESSNTNLVTIDINGNMKALRAGNVTISAYPKGVSWKKTQVPFTVASIPYKIIFKGNGGTPSESVKQMQYGGTPLNYGKLPTASKKGYTFTGWFTAATGGTKITETTKITTSTDITVYAQWRISTYRITYNANSGSGAPGVQTKTHGRNLTLSTTRPTRTGYRFKGWAESAKATSVKYKPGAKFTNEKNTTLYAVWAANKYTIAYNKNGGRGKLSNTKATYAKSIRLRANTLKRKGHKFNGWTVRRKSDKKRLYAKGNKKGWYAKNKQPAGYKLKVYKNKAKVKNLTNKANDRVVMYARWKKQ